MAKTSDYDSTATCIQLTQLTCEHSGNDPYEWQLDISEAVLLGLDTILLASTGAGKTLPFIMPLMLDKKKKGDHHITFESITGGSGALLDLGADKSSANLCRPKDLRNLMFLLLL